MNAFILSGTITVNLALICYSIAIIGEQRHKRITTYLFTFLSLGVVLDIIATALMITGSTQSAISAHGLLGYSALLLMFVDWVLMLRFKRTYTADATVRNGLHFYSRYAYIWWIIAYITGAALVAMRHI